MDKGFQILFLLTTIFCYAEFSEVVVVKKGLSCYTCFEYDDHCVSMKNISLILTSKCMPEETFCTVRRLHDQGKLTTFERGCSRDCEPGCNTAAEYLKCTSCCNSTLCNVDNAVDRTYYTSFTLAGVIACRLVMENLMLRHNTV